MTEPDAPCGAPEPQVFSRLVIGAPSEGLSGPVALPGPAEAPSLLLGDGVVSWFDDEEGWGAIRSDAGHDVFAHYSAIDAPDYRTLSAGQRVHLTYRPGDQDGYLWVAEVIRAL